MINYLTTADLDKTRDIYIDQTSYSSLDLEAFFSEQILSSDLILSERIKTVILNFFTLD